MPDQGPSNNKDVGGAVVCGKVVYQKLTASLRDYIQSKNKTVKKNLQNSLNNLNEKGALIGRRVGREIKRTKKINSSHGLNPYLQSIS